MPSPKIPKLRRVHRCSHKHYSGRRCSQPVARGTWDNQNERLVYLCWLHKAGTCTECDAMMRAFPIRKTVKEGANQ